MKLKKPKFMYFLTHNSFYNCMYFSNSGKMWIWYFEKKTDLIMFDGYKTNFNVIYLPPGCVKIVSENEFLSALTKKNEVIQEYFLEFHGKFSK